MYDINQWRWDKLFRRIDQWDPSTLGGVSDLDGTVFWKVEVMNEIARLLELIHNAPQVANPVLDDDLDAFEEGQLFESNLFQWFTDPTLQGPGRDRLCVPTNFVRHAPSIGQGKGLYTAMIILWVPANNDYGKADYFDLLNFDADRKRISRMGGQVFTEHHEFHTDELDEALREYFAKLMPDYEYVDMAQATQILQEFRDFLSLREFIALTLPDFATDDKIVLKMWTWWLYRVWLHFGQLSFEGALREALLYVKGRPKRDLGNAILNFYPSFTGSANLAVFGARDFLFHRKEEEHVPEYEEKLVDFMVHLPPVPRS